MAGFRCDICNKDFSSKDSLEQHNGMKHSNAPTENKPSHAAHHSPGKKKSNVFLYSIIALIIVFLFLTFNSKNSSAGELDSFAKCLSEKGSVVYGNDFCTYTGHQLNNFGSSDKYLNYVKCVDNEALCDEKNVRLTPTWEINGQFYEGVQSLEKLSSASGCSLNS